MQHVGSYIDTEKQLTFLEVKQIMWNHISFLLSVRFSQFFFCQPNEDCEDVNDHYLASVNATQGKAHGSYNYGCVFICCGRSAESQNCEASRDRLLGNGSANKSVARKQFYNTQQWSNWESLFSKQSVPIATWCKKRWNVVRGVFYAAK
jgi:hypothetical protein